MVLVRGGITVKPHVQRCADAVVAEFGDSLSPGTYNGHSPPEGPTQAIDLFTPESPTGWELQARIAAWLIQNQKRYGIRYVIRHNPNGLDWIWNIERADEGWRAMATNDHRNHVHVTFYSRVETSEPDVPAPVKGMDMGSLAVRFIYKDQTLGRVGNLDYVFDGPSRIFQAVGSVGVLKACDECDMPAIGEVAQGDFEWFSAQAKKWERD